MKKEAFCCRLCSSPYTLGEGFHALVMTEVMRPNLLHRLLGRQVMMFGGSMLTREHHVLLCDNCYRDEAGAVVRWAGGGASTSFFVSLTVSFLIFCAIFTMGSNVYPDFAITLAWGLLGAVAGGKLLYAYLRFNAQARLAHKLALYRIHTLEADCLADDVEMT